MLSPVAKVKIGPAGLSRQNIRGVDILQIVWSKEHIAPINSKVQLTTPSHPRHEIMKRKWEARTDPLWWNCLTSGKVGPKSAVRSWLSNRARAAFVQALKRKGYDTNGRRIDGNGAGVPKPNLVGSVHMMTRAELLRAKWPEVEEQADKIVAEIERLQTEMPKRPKVKRKNDGMIPKQSLNSVDR
ncbi:hypothetical protein V492_03584 [Pseudogymnoascus sp. VKM F-4246]|nr:hypothetical protein V492_03584 [Pseudogymnoascus sp. VKM F-4246]